VRSIRVFAKNLGDLYYEPTIVVHDNVGDCCIRDRTLNRINYIVIQCLNKNESTTANI